MNDHDPIIYHLVPEPDFARDTADGFYRPPSLATEGFVHCTAGEETAMAVANDYYANVTVPLLLLKIEVAKVQPRVVFEAPAHAADAGTEHLAMAALFPHVYGGINLDAVVGLGRVFRDEAGFHWPRSFAE